MVVLGNRQNSDINQLDAVTVRYKPGGTLDTAFGENG
ncbi:hypothetical protein [Phaeobacter sp. NW0010-22]